MRKTLDEIRAILDMHREELRREHTISDIAVFGSYVSGEQKKRSDIDLLAEFETSVSLLDLVGAEHYLTKILKVTVDLIPKEDIRPELRDRVLAEAVTV
jgi:hypothetical protein